MQELHENLRLDLTFRRQQIVKYANRKRLRGPILKGGDKVYLLRRNIKSKKPSKKLDNVNDPEVGHTQKSDSTQAVWHIRRLV
jgi:hypothetical protein